MSWRSAAKISEGSAVGNSLKMAPRAEYFFLRNSSNWYFSGGTVLPTTSIPSHLFIHFLRCNLNTGYSLLTTHRRHLMSSSNFSPPLPTSSSNASEVKMEPSTGKDTWSFPRTIALPPSAASIPEVIMSDAEAPPPKPSSTVQKRKRVSKAPGKPAKRSKLSREGARIWPTPSTPLESMASKGFEKSTPWSTSNSTEDSPLLQWLTYNLARTPQMSISYSALLDAVRLDASMTILTLLESLSLAQMVSGSMVTNPSPKYCLTTLMGDNQNGLFSNSCELSTGIHSESLSRAPSLPGHPRSSTLQPTSTPATGTTGLTESNSGPLSFDDSLTLSGGILMNPPEC